MNTFLYTGTDEAVNKIHHIKEQGWLELLEAALEEEKALPAWQETALNALGQTLIDLGTSCKRRASRLQPQA